MHVALLTWRHNQTLLHTVSTTNLDNNPDEDKKDEGKKENVTDKGPQIKSFKTVFESTEKRPEDKRKRIRKDNPEDIDNFMGPWGGYVDENKISKPSEVIFIFINK